MRKPFQSMVAALMLLTPAAAFAATDIAMHRDPGCQCYEKWAARVRQQFGRNVRITDDANRAAFQRQAGVPAALSSCHATMIDGMAFEGHVPIEDMKRVLLQDPRELTGLAVAGMPMGSPGMEIAGMKPQPFDVVAFGPGGQKVFAHH
jgi:hypothetical protein